MEERVLLIDVHAAPARLAPAEFAKAVQEAGLEGAVIATDLDRWSDYADAFDDLSLVPFVGLALPLKRGTLVFIPRDADDEALDAVDWSAPDEGLTGAEARARVKGLDGLLVTTHPYFRDETAPAIGDRVYGLKGLGGVVTRVGAGKLSWDALADAFAGKRGIARLGSAGGDVHTLGRAATVVPEGIETQEGLVNAIEAGLTLPVELDDPAQPKDRRPPPAPVRREDRGPRRDGGGRGDRRGGRGRDDRRGGGRDRGGRGERKGGRR
jgi:hypothetical protein